MKQRGDYLRRYLYEKTQPSEPFSQVPDEYYEAVIRDSFAMNRAPHAFGPVKTRWSNIIKRWLCSGSAKRSTVFLLGFGLNMTDKEVSVFLTKVLKEQDFRFDDRTETAFWHCYHHGLPYSSAVALLEECRSAGALEAGADDTETDAFWNSVGDSLTLYLSNKNKIREYLRRLAGRKSQPEDVLYEEFQKVYDRSVLAAKQVAGSASFETVAQEEDSRTSAAAGEKSIRSGSEKKT